MSACGVYVSVINLTYRLVYRDGVYGVGGVVYFLYGNKKSQ